MARVHLSIFFAAALTGAVLGAGPGAAQDAVKPVELPDPVSNTFKAQFPKAEILKLTAEVEDGVTVYDFEFKDGEADKETDIAADGTMLEHTLVIEADGVPAAAMKSISKHAKGAKLGRLERIEVSYEIDEGEIVKLPKPITRYAAEMTKGEKMAEVIVNSDGSVFEAPEWIPIETTPQAQPAK